MKKRQVKDIVADLLRKPHSSTLLAISTCFISSVAVARDNSISQQNNILTGMCYVMLFCFVNSGLRSYDGPFIRPHPALWRCVFGCSVAYLALLLFVLFQDYATIRAIVIFFFPDAKNFNNDMIEGTWSEDCYPVTLDNIWSNMDIYVVSHLLGWSLKATVVRHYGVVWTMSVMWEVTELLFIHLLPMLAECWWDIIVIDMLISNGIGIFIGMQACRWLEVREYKWESIKDPSPSDSKTGCSQSRSPTPSSGVHAHWMDVNSRYMRVLYVSVMVVSSSMVDLNAFLLKHVLQLPIGSLFHPGRLCCWMATAAPTISQVHLYVTDRRCERLGLQVCVSIWVLLTEVLVCVKHDREFFQRAAVANLLVWLALHIALTGCCLWLCEVWNQRSAGVEVRTGGRGHGSVGMRRGDETNHRRARKSLR
ncbi:phosphatidylserine synthase 1-like [Pollicipes pollicipes]|uniref:phosphatidylserine synthase 1-like n=1 Tax=Pollicipes pollicipes TaxID=41117 RepID=UPI001884E9FD|nr:phosphatidylserine synthase 1-like [Pollicipes pollicipes]